jgi:hypothetical protein
MDRYFRNSYKETLSNGTIENRYIYAHYNEDTFQWAFKDYDGSTLVNLCFIDNGYSKLNAIFDIYANTYIDEITKEQYENLE